MKHGSNTSAIVTKLIVNINYYIVSFYDLNKKTTTKNVYDLRIMLFIGQNHPLNN